MWRQWQVQEWCTVIHTLFLSHGMLPKTLKILSVRKVFHYNYVSLPQHFSFCPAAASQTSAQQSGVGCGCVEKHRTGICELNCFPFFFCLVCMKYCQMTLNIEQPISKMGRCGLWRKPRCPVWSWFVTVELTRSGFAALSNTWGLVCCAVLGAS